MGHQAVIVDIVRTPLGRSKAGGAFVDVHPTELLAQVLAGLIQRNDLDLCSVDDVIVGCVSQAGEQSATPGRVAWLAAGFPEHVPSTTVDRKCGSSQQAIHFAAQGVMAGAYDIVVAAGVESMSRVPMGSARMGQTLTAHRSMRAMRRARLDRVLPPISLRRNGVSRAITSMVTQPNRTGEPKQQGFPASSPAKSCRSASRAPTAGG